MKRSAISFIFIFLAFLFCVVIFQNHLAGIVVENVPVDWKNSVTVKDNSIKKEYTDFHYA